MYPLQICIFSFRICPTWQLCGSLIFSINFWICRFCPFYQYHCGSVFFNLRSVLSVKISSDLYFSSKYPCGSVLSSNISLRIRTFPLSIIADLSFLAISSRICIFQLPYLSYLAIVSLRISTFSINDFSDYVLSMNVSRTADLYFSTCGSVQYGKIYLRISFSHK